MDNMTTFLVVIVTVVLVMWIIRAIKMYPDYKRGIYKELYGNFLLYAWYVIALSDASKSMTLRNEIGKSYIYFSRMQDNGKVTGNFCTIFYNRQIYSICFEYIGGELKGYIDDSRWTVFRKDKKTGEQKSYKHDSSYKAFKAYTKRLKQLFRDTNVETCFAFSDDTDFSKLKGEYKAIHYSELIDTLKNNEAAVITDEQIDELFKKISSGK